MSSFFGRFKGNSGLSSAGGSSFPVKKDSTITPQSPLEALLANSGPVRHDGSDKFFGMQNPSNTCYCNSVIQCLYYSEPFREKVINFPYRPDPLASKGLSIRTPQPTQLQVTGAAGALGSPIQSPKDTPKVPQRFTASPSTHTVSPAKAEDVNKDSFDYQKKMAIQIGPFFEITYDNSSAYGMPTSLFTGLKDIFEAIVSQRAKFGVFALNRFLQTLREGFETFRTPLHQDAHEFLNILLNDVVTKVEDYSKANPDVIEPAQSGQLPINTIHVDKGIVDSSNSTNTSWVHELFEGTLTSETRCLTCETISQRDEVFLDLSVDLDEHSSVTSCLRRFSEEEMLRERNKFHCDHCSGLQEAEKRMKIKRLPRILALHLKRFKYTEELGRLQKLFHRVVFPFHLRLFNTTDDTEDPDRLYELYAIIVHLGSTPFHGHYVSIIKTKDHGWLLFDDELVLPVDKNYVRNFFGGDPRNPACAYVLFYQQTTVEAALRDQEMDIVNDNSAASDDQTAGDSSKQGNNEFLQKGADHLGIVNSTPIEDLNAFASLNHAISTPMALPKEPTSPNTIEPVISSPGFLNARPSNSSVLTNAGSTDDGSNAADDGVEAQTKPKFKVTDKSEDLTTSRDNEQHVKTGSFSRFRPSSMSIRQRQKPRNSSPHNSPIGQEQMEAPTSTLTSTPEKSKLGRFGLGKKKSPFLP